MQNTGNEGGREEGRAKECKSQGRKEIRKKG